MTRPSDEGSPAGTESCANKNVPHKKTSKRPASGDRAGNTDAPEGMPIERASQKGRKRSQFRRRNDGAIYGALDLGTNNCRLLVARPTRRGFLVIDAFSRIIRLGEGMSRSGRLSDAAMDRTIEALKVCSQKMRNQGVKRSRLIATEACRVASNSAEFIDRVLDQAGLKLEIISQETEAKLAVSGCASLLDRTCEWALVFDIGGGSSELIWLDLSRWRHSWRRSLLDRVEAQKSIVAWTSLPIGVVTLAEKFGGQDVDQTIFETMVEYVTEHLLGFEKQHQIAHHFVNSKTHLLGTSGTVTTVAGIHLGLPCYDRNRVDGSWLNEQEVRIVSEQLIKMSYDERVAQPCIGPDRADLVLAGCAILEALMRLWPSERLRVADRGLREGILAMLMAEDGHKGKRDLGHTRRS